MTESILETLLSSESTKSPFYPTISTLLLDPFFAAISDRLFEDKPSKKPYLKFSATSKEELAKAKQAIESRLADDFKKVITECFTKMISVRISPQSKI
jgi:hypothetical protein